MEQRSVYDEIKRDILNDIPLTISEARDLVIYSLSRYVMCRCPLLSGFERTDD